MTLRLKPKDGIVTVQIPPGGVAIVEISNTDNAD